MRRVPGEPSPAEAIAQRMRGLEAELREARQALRRNRKRSDPSARWSLEPQAAEASQDELWFITYLDMMTLMLVAMIVMLAFSGSIGKRAPAPGATIQAASPAASSPPAASVALAPIPAPDEAFPYPAAPAAELLFAPPPPAEPERSPLFGTFPDIDTGVAGTGVAAAPAPAPAVEAPAVRPGPQADSAAAPAPASEPGAEPGSAPGPRPHADFVGPPAPPAPVSQDAAPAAPAAGTGTGEPDAAAAAPSAPAAPAAPAPSGPQAAPAAPPSPAPARENGDRAAPAQEPEPAESSEGAALAASLPLGELGHDVEVIVNRRSISFRINSEILFDTGQADLSRAGLSVLQRMAKVLSDAGYDITVEGHTDSVPVRSNARYPSNWELSSARAGSVVRYLQANGIAKGHLKAVGYADARPIADNRSADGRARNRRVELVVERPHEDRSEAGPAGTHPAPGTATR
ncbi:Flagellar motor rotation protein MotB [Castellaniella defragrans 65Phen]|uniref:Flagellar motor rotation protein MotB n=1 Tax=Castellaniella defragrans (strain DSM 12143 / CCUG 39792 / 65Phen) TaxID=1437824 RepID=W8X3Y3_CASD6|nr:OmpA family protein [Castellaniella defragrans]CDM24482.1 Flagellar motor rotation protein MotB [Castellaniella defragrans 65Phen]